MSCRSTGMLAGFSGRRPPPGETCGRPSEDGHDGLCRFHANRARMGRVPGADVPRPPPPPLPAWMQDPSLLPKLPPGRAA